MTHHALKLLDAFGILYTDSLFVVVSNILYILSLPKVEAINMDDKKDKTIKANYIMIITDV